MRTLRLTPCYLILPLCMAGCASTKAVSPKTVAWYAEQAKTTDLNPKPSSSDTVERSLTAGPDR